MYRRVAGILTLVVGPLFGLPAHAQVAGTAKGAANAAIRVPGSSVRAPASASAGADFDAARQRINADAGMRQRLSTGAGRLRSAAKVHTSVNADLHARSNQPDAAAQSRQPKAKTNESRNESSENSGNVSSESESHLRLDPPLLSNSVRAKIDARFSQRMAEIDRVRDAALARADVRLLEQADAMEQRLRMEFEHENKLEVTTAIDGQQQVEGALRQHSSTTAQGQVSLEENSRESRQTVELEHSSNAKMGVSGRGISRLPVPRASATAQEHANVHSRVQRSRTVDADTDVNAQQTVTGRVARNRSKPTSSEPAPAPQPMPGPQVSDGASN